MEPYQKYPRLLDIQDVAKIVSDKLREIVIIPAVKGAWNIKLDDDDLKAGRPRVTVQSFKDEHRCFVVVVDYDGNLGSSYTCKLEDGRDVEFRFNYIHLLFMLDETDRYITTRVPISKGENSVHGRILTFTNNVRSTGTHDIEPTKKKNV